MGVGALLPFNCIIIPVDFYVAYYSSWFLTAASLSFNAGVWLVMIFMLFVGYKLNKHILIFSAMSIWIICLIAIPLLFPLIDN